MKHVGKYGEKPCVVVFREVPNEPENCLIVQTGNLSDSEHDVLMGVVQSQEAQTANNISEVLHRRQFSDGSNILTSLHYGKKIQKVPVSLVSLTPTPSDSVPLADVNAEIRKLEGGYVPPKNDSTHLNESVAPPTEQLVESGADASATDQASGDSIASNLMLQAQLLEEDAQQLLKEAEAKREEALKLNPDLAPKKRGRPKKETA